MELQPVQKMSSNSPRPKRKANNERVPASEIKLFVCMLCGDHMTKNDDYHRHMTAHQMLSYAYQVHHYQKVSKKRKMIPESDTIVAHSEERLQSPVGSPGFPGSKYREDGTVERRGRPRKIDVERRLSALREGSPPKETTVCCVFCSLRVPSVCDLAHHICQVHEGAVKEQKMIFMKRGVVVARKSLAASPVCTPCKANFSSDSKYFLHSMRFHTHYLFSLEENAFPGITEAEVHTLISAPNGDISLKNNETNDGSHLVKLLISILTRRLVRSIWTMTTKRFGKDEIGLKKLNVEDPKKVSDAQWREALPQEVYEVARRSGTEPAHSGGYDKYFEKGRYVCLCCGAELFNSDSKYWAGCGWPAFSKSIDEDLNIVRIKDTSYGMERTEVRCKKCDAHLGHVFDDGPEADGGERYCINSVCMAFEPATEETNGNK